MPVPARTAPTPTLLLDSAEVLRLGAREALESTGEFEVVAESGSLAEAGAALEQHRPGLLVTELDLVDGSAAALVRTQRRAHPGLGVVVLTALPGDDPLFTAMEAGASALVRKDAPAAELVGAARHAVVSPRSFTCKDLSEAMMRRLAEPRIRLTPRESEVLVLLAEGLGTAAVAARLFVSEATAKFHIAKIYDKLGAGNRAQAMVTAMREGLLPRDAGARHTPGPGGGSRTTG